MRLLCRENYFIYLLAFSFLSVALAAVVSGPRLPPANPQQPNSLSPTPHVTLTSVHFPIDDSQEKSKDGALIEGVIFKFMRQIIKSQFELGVLNKENFKFIGSPAKPDKEGRYKFDLTLSLDPPISDWKGKGAVRFEEGGFMQQTRIWGTLNDTVGGRVAAINDNEFDMNLFMRGRPMDVYLSKSKDDIGEKKSVY
ncbi:hypothetical protein GGU10DRAFT_370825 [Lentinula aff. detonsa]|uniref:Uncharacterized protein n=1 Tax=Lentinula aff. detonsa TaxID=2804958 RepID=A0AA38NTR4_9AGAR|nr:hypothetical protein GGU10DRAFT_370825 [Lentinula aff. detonsa]